MNQISVLEQRCQIDHTWNMTLGQIDCVKIMSYIRAVSGGVSSFDARIFGQDWVPVKGPFIDMLTKSRKKEDIYKALHVAASYKKPVFEASSKAVAAAYQSSNLVDFSSYYNYLIQENIPLIVMAGEFDMRDGV